MVPFVVAKTAYTFIQEIKMKCVFIHGIIDFLVRGRPGERGGNIGWLGSVCFFAQYIFRTYFIQEKTEHEC